MINSKNSALKKFNTTKKRNVDLLKKDELFKKKSFDWMIYAEKYKYVYNFNWMGIPIIKYPNDIIALQEILWEMKPDLVIETGVAHGGSIIFIASILHMINNTSKVICIDLEIREHNLEEIKKNRLFKKI